MGIRDVIPTLYLRLGRDQECYDFLKWWATAAKASKYNWGATSLPYLDVKDADVFELSDIFVRRHADLSHNVAVTLIKTRLLLDVKSLQSAAVLGEKVPQEIVDRIRAQPVSSVVLQNKEIMLSKDRSSLITELEEQIDELYSFMDTSNPHF